MVEAAVKGNGKKDTADTQQICVDDNGNAVCQIYKISVTNNGTAGMFLDGYVALQGGSDSATVPADYTATNKGPEGTGTPNATTMRWAQVFCSAESSNLVTACTTAGKSTVRATKDIDLVLIVEAVDKNFGIIELFARYHTYKYLNYSHLCYKIMSGASVKSCKSNF